MQQLSVFELLDEYETPTVSPDELQDGDKLWIAIIEGMITNSFDYDAPIREVVGRACRIQVSKRGDHFWWDSIDHKGYRGGSCLPEPLFCKIPSDADIMKFIRKRAPESVWTGQLTPETVWRVIDVKTMRSMSLKDE